MKKKTSKTKLHFKQYKSIYVLIALEVIMVWFFLLAWSDCSPLSSKNLDDVTIYVEHTTRLSGKQSLFVVYSGDESYYFPSRGSYAGYTNSKLGDVIQRGDKIHLTYFEDRWLLGFAKRNMVVEAHTDTVQLRTVEEYMESKEGLQSFFAILFVLGEVLYCFGVFAYFRANRKRFAQLRKTRKKRREKRKRQGKVQEH